MNNIINQKFNRLTVLKFNHKDKWHHLFYKCICDCNNKTIVRKDLLKSGKVSSCGCYRKECAKLLIKENSKKLHKHDMSKTPFYKCYHGLRQRCENSNCRDYKYYGKRGITYDPKWKDFETFYYEMYFKYLYAVKQLRLKIPSIERIDVNNNYTKENCTFIEKNEQAYNTRHLKWFKAISPFGKIYLAKNQSKFARQHNLKQQSIAKCLTGKQKTYKKWKFKLI